MKSHLLKMYGMTLGEAQKLVADVPCERFAEFAQGVQKHPGWVLGHLCAASHMGAGFLNQDPGEAGSWMENTMPGKPVTAEQGDYETKANLLAALERTHAAMARGLEQASDAMLAAEFPIEDYRSFFPTIGDATFYLMAYHEGYHLGQLTQWRMASGFGPVGDP